MIEMFKRLFGKKGDDSNFGNTPPDPGVVCSTDGRGQLVISVPGGVYMFRKDGTFVFTPKPLA